MDCKYCGQPLEEGNTLCPACQRDNADGESAEKTAAPEEVVAEEAAAEEVAAEETAAEEAAAEEAAAEEATAEEAAAEEAAAEEAADEEAAAEETATEEVAAAEEKLSEAEATESQTEKLQKPQKNIGLLIGISAAVLVLLGLVIFFVIKGINKPNTDPTETTQPAETTEAAQTTEATAETAFAIEGTGKSDEVTCKSSYTQVGLTADDAEMAANFAKCADVELTVGEFQIFYQMQLNDFMNDYGYYATMMYGLDTSLPLSEQECALQEGNTWEQFFIQLAVEQYREYAVLYTEAKAKGFDAGAELQSYLDALPASLEENAVSAGYAGALEYVQAAFGKGVKLEDYYRYAEVVNTAMAYGSGLYSGITYTDEDISAYFDANAETYASQNIEKTDVYNVNVRHILIQPEDADGDGTPTDEEKAAAKEKADQLYATYKENATEDNFSVMANENSSDTGSNSNGGLYEDVYPGQMTTEFNDWCFAEGRQPGDTDIVETSYGYHIIYFVGTTENLYWFTTAKSDYLNDKMGELVNALKSNYELTVDYSALVIVEPEAAEQGAE